MMNASLFLQRQRLSLATTRSIQPPFYQSLRKRATKSSSLAHQHDNHKEDDDEHAPLHDNHMQHQQHCPTCSCSPETTATQKYRQQHESLPPPLPEPKYSVYKRILPPNLTHLSSSVGRNMLLQALLQQTAHSYWSLTEHGMNQSDPAYCGITTLLVVLNSMAVDPQTIRWRGGWRYYANEDVLLAHCCFSASAAKIQRVGITMEEFKQLAHCRGVSNIQLKRPSSTYTMDDFRRDVKNTLCACASVPDDDSSFDMTTTTPPPTSFLVVSFSRAALGQTGDGHFSPVAAYHEETDSVLVLDVARFKYPPYWTTIEDLYQAMIPPDPMTAHKSRGWFVMESPMTTKNSATAQQQDDELLSIMQEEQRRPAHLVPLVGQPDICPIGKIKMEYCKAGVATTIAKRVVVESAELQQKARRGYSSTKWRNE